MELRAVKYGGVRAVGRDLWACSRGEYGDCEKTLSAEEGDAAISLGRVEPPEVPVSWAPFLTHDKYSAEYLSVGAFPGSLPRAAVLKDVHARRTLTQFVLLSRPRRDRQPTPDSEFVAAVLSKFLRRGHAPPPTLGVERAALESERLLESAERLHAPRADGRQPIEIGWKLEGSVSANAVVSSSLGRQGFELDPYFRYDARDPGLSTRLTEAEDAFLRDWAPAELGNRAGHWFVPQAPMDALLATSGEAPPQSDQRVDFLFCHPSAKPFVIEIDGDSHQRQRGLDRVRDRQLAAAGVDVVRIPNAEVLCGEGPHLDGVRARCREAVAETVRPSPLENVVLRCVRATWVQFALLRAIGQGLLLPKRRWELRFEAADAVVGAGVRDLLDLLSAAEDIYGLTATPNLCVVRMPDRSRSLRWAGAVWEEEEDRQVDPEAHDTDRLRIRVETDASPFHRISGPGTDAREPPDLILRPACVPGEISMQDHLGHIPLRRAREGLPGHALRTFLRHGFRKFEFREKQAEAVHNALRGNDCIVLLATGAGKSLIYQLAGLLQPGVTLVVAPLIALIEDQQRGMERHGLDRAAGIHSGLDSEAQEGVMACLREGAGHFLLIAPERLQNREFRKELRALVDDVSVNLNVVDEAHCVSEWGHDFRPAYLSLGPNLRQLTTGSDEPEKPPPILGLTGTASRAVLRDTLADLGIDRRRSDAVIRPDSFDRQELAFRIVRHRSRDEARGAIPGILRRLPRALRIPRSRFFIPRGRDTQAGIVFCRTVKGRDGITETSNLVEKATGRKAALYSGGKPKTFHGGGAAWARRKREEARRFIENEAPILVATKAFGMGIDKPNIRFIVIHGVPGSLEEFYQLAGRAGRDQRQSECVLVASEWDQEETETMLADGRGFDAVRDEYRNWSLQRQFTDDLANQLFFHCSNFAGLERDLQDIEGVLRELPDPWKEVPNQRIPFAPKQGRTEGAIYRLRRIGVVSDYRRVGRAFEVDITRPDRDSWCEVLSDYLRTVLPGTSRPYRRRVEQVPDGPPRTVVRSLARILLDFTYDHIERSRRRMMSEALRWAREARTDAEIRRRLLDYLQEGVGFEQISELADEPDIDIRKWWQFLREKAVSGVEAGELRGIFIRVLESDPEHPGLRLARGVAETWCSDRDDAVAAGEMVAAFRQLDRLEVDPSQVMKWAEDAVEFVAEDTERGRPLAFPLAYALSSVTADRDASRNAPCISGLARYRRRLLGDLARGSGDSKAETVFKSALIGDTWGHMETRMPMIRSWLGRDEPARIATQGEPE